MSINDIIATNSIRAYETGVKEGRRQLKEELEQELLREAKEVEQSEHTGLWGIYKALHFLRKEVK